MSTPIGAPHPGEARSFCEPGFAAQCLHAASERLPAMRATLATQRETSISEYVRRLTATSAQPVQPRADLLERVRRACIAPLGERGAQEAAANLDAHPAVLTANHHGVDYFAQSVQSTLALALETPLTREGTPGTTIVLACGAVPLNNLTYPRGLLAYSGPSVARSAVPQRIPVFPDSRKRELVSFADAFDGQMVKRAAQRIDRLAAGAELPAGVARAARAVLDEDYADPAVLGASTYSEQASRLNARIWTRLFQVPDAMPRLAYLELERLAAELLVVDVTDTSSLAWTVLFDAPMREAVHSTLDGVRGCWDAGALTSRRLDRTRADAAGASTGSTFFWGVDGSGHRVPMELRAGAGETARLVGVTERGGELEVLLNPVSLAEALRTRRVFPSLFTSYLCVSLARGVTCLGGYYQAEYLPAMQNGVVQAIRSTLGDDSLADGVAAVATHGYLSGMQAVMSPDATGGLLPAGPLEIIAAGGLTADDISRMAGMSVYDAHLGSTVDTVADAARELAAQEGWGRRVAADLGLKLAPTAVVKVH